MEPGRLATRWETAPTAVKVAAMALVLNAMSLPLVIGFGYVLDPQPLPRGSLTATQVGVGIAVVLLMVMGLLALMAYLLLRRSRVVWLLAVAFGVAATSTGRPAGFLLLYVLALLLSLATWLPLLLPPVVLWFWKRPSMPSAYDGASELRRPD